MAALHTFEMSAKNSLAPLANFAESPEMRRRTWSEERSKVPSKLTPG
jgi:hypothetical protein